MIGTPRISTALTLTLVFAPLGFLIWMGKIMGANGALLALQGASGALMLWARWHLRLRSFRAGPLPSHGPLVTTGPYRYLRHPIYAAALWFLWAGVLGHGAWMPVALATVTTAGLVWRVLSEEAQLRLVFSDYQNYTARTHRLIPFIW